MTWLRRKLRSMIASEISSAARYADACYQIFREPEMTERSCSGSTVPERVF